MLIRIRIPNETNVDLKPCEKTLIWFYLRRGGGGSNTWAPEVLCGYHSLQAYTNTTASRSIIKV
jgi:hypothetical protein